MYFNYNITKKLIVGIMSLFDDITVQKYSFDVNTQTFTSRKFITVPLQYASREKFLEIMQSSSARKQMNPDANIAPVEIQWLLPRISFNIQGIVYDSERHGNKLNKLMYNHGMDSLYGPVPYNLEMEVCTISKTMDEAFQMMEQIIPMFTPSVSLDITILDNPESIPISLSSVSFDFPAEVSEDETRLWTISYYFNVRANYYNFKRSSSKILHINSIMSIIESNEINTTYQQYVANAANPYPPSLSGNDTINLTLNNRGIFDLTAIYNEYDLMYNDHYKYVCILNNTTGIIPGVDDDWKKYWVLLNVLQNNGIEYKFAPIGIAEVGSTLEVGPCNPPLETIVSYIEPTTQTLNGLSTIIS